MEKIPVIIDCDPGVDDCYAVALAHAHPGFEIVALTAVAGNVPAEKTRRNARLLSEYLEIPCRVAFGAKKPLEKPYLEDAAFVHGASGVGDLILPEPKKEPDGEPAWEVIYQEAVKHSGKLLLFATGPLTDIAMALRLHPDLPKHIGTFCLMGGGTFGNAGAAKKAEFNIWVDPTAAKEVFEKLPGLYMVGLNATHQGALSPADLDEMIRLCKEGTGPVSSFFENLTRFSKRKTQEEGTDNNVIHDALAVASMIRPDLVKFQDCFVQVEADGRAENEGETLIDPSKSPNCHVAMEVNQPLFAAMLKEVCRHYAGK